MNICVVATVFCALALQQDAIGRCVLLCVYAFFLFLTVNTLALEYLCCLLCLLSPRVLSQDIIVVVLD